MKTKKALKITGITLLALLFAASIGLNIYLGFFSDFITENSFLSLRTPRP